MLLQCRNKLLGLFLLGKGAGHTHHDSLGIATPQQTQLFRMRMLGKFVLYRCRCDKLTLYGFEIILHPAGQENKAFLINPGFVARINPTIAKGFGRFLRVLVISRGKP